MAISGIVSLEISVIVVESHLTLRVNELVMSQEIHENHITVRINWRHNATFVLNVTRPQSLLSSMSRYLHLFSMTACTIVPVSCFIVIALNSKMKLSRSSSTHFIIIMKVFSPLYIAKVFIQTVAATSNQEVK